MLKPLPGNDRFGQGYGTATLLYIVRVEERQLGITREIASIKHSLAYWDGAYRIAAQVLPNISHEKPIQTFSPPTCQPLTA